MLKNGGLDPSLFCLTSSETDAHDFYNRGDGGTVVLHNESTIRLCGALNIFDDHVFAGFQDDSYGEQKERRKMRQEFAAIVQRIVGPDSYVKPKLSMPHEEFGWRDPPHVDRFDAIALLCGRERPTEINSGDLVAAADYPANDEIKKKDWKGVPAAKRERQWGISPSKLLGRRAMKDFGLFAPVSFYQPALILLIGNAAASHYVLHRIPRPMAGHMERGYILKCTVQG